MKSSQSLYQGVEQGPIRPPNEAYSLLIRITRNCPWNHCTFCPVYKEEDFSLRSVEDVKQDIDTLFKYAEILQTWINEGRQIAVSTLRDLCLQIDGAATEANVYVPLSILNWLSTGMKTVFLQDANSLVIKPKDLIAILEHLKQRFPQVQRITSYARSQTLAKMKIEDLRAICNAGLNRVHIGMESGSDNVLTLMKKGTTKAMQIKAGLNVKEAGMELSEYYMPGLGGQHYSQEHAVESADALNQINPDFIRLRTLAIPENVPLFQDYQMRKFTKCSDLMVIEETKTFLQHLTQVTSVIASDHILNLLPELQGKLPEERDRLLKVLQEFLEADPQRQRLYQVARRCGLLSSLDHLDDPQIHEKAQQLCNKLSTVTEDVEDVVDQLANMTFKTRYSDAKPSL
ncbi:MAG: coproporphyrinogen III oxidase [Beggiatoa sp. IS2]|nr:MAG: coproporphyrinogen III oxidase [Beggiatoa sp. IS2]